MNKFRGILEVFAILSCTVGICRHPPHSRRFKRPQSCYVMTARNTEGVTSLPSVLAPLESFDQVFEYRIQAIYSERNKVGPRCEYRKTFWSRREKELGGKGRDARVAPLVYVLMEKPLAHLQYSHAVWCNCEVGSQLLCSLSRNLIA